MGDISPANVDKLRGLCDQVVRAWRAKSRQLSHIPIKTMVVAGLMEDGSVWLLTVGDSVLPMPIEAQQLAILGSAAGIASSTLVESAIRAVQPEPAPEAG